MDGRTSIFMPHGGKSSRTDDWSTPREVLEALDREFQFTKDACPLVDGAKAGLPLFGTDALLDSWKGERIFCNPPYSGIAPWLAKARQATLAVFLVPARTDTDWWHRYAMRADEIPVHPRAAEVRRREDLCPVPERDPGLQTGGRRR